MKTRSSIPLRLAAAVRFGAALAGAALVFFTVPPLAAEPAPDSSDAPDPVIWTALDIFLPGAGAWRREQPYWSIFFASTRLATAWYAYQFHIEHLEYRSAARAAQLGDLYYGPGLLYRDPYGDGYRNADGFQREADRRSYLSSLMIGIHILLAGVSAYQTASWALEEQRAAQPQLEIGVDQNEGDRPRGARSGAAQAPVYAGLRLDLRWRLAAY